MQLNLDSAIFIGFLMVTLVLGLASSRGITTIREYAVGDRNFSTATIVATIVATFVAGGFFYNNIYETYTGGLYSMIALAGDSISLLLIGALLAPRMGEFLGKLSIAEAMGDLFGQKVRIITSLLGFIGAAGAIAIQLKLAGLIFEYASIVPTKYGTILAAIIITLYSSLGGIKSVTFTDIVQFFTFCVVIPIIAYVLLISIGDFSNITETLATSPLFDYREVFDLSNPLSFNKFFLLLFFVIPGFAPVLFQRVAMAKNTTQVKRSFMIASVVCLGLSLVLNWIGILTLSINPDLKGDEIVKYVIFNSYYPGITGAALAGVMAMLMSTADSWINSASILIVHDFLKPLKMKLSGDELFSTRCTALCLGIFSLTLSLFKGSLLDLMLLSFSFYMSIVTVPFLMAIFGFRSSEKSVILGMAAGFITVLTWDHVLQIKAANSIPVAMLANLVVLMGSHYLLRQPGGWVGIKDDSDLITARRERKRKWQKFLTKVESFNLIQFCKNNSPKGDGLISILGFFVMISAFGSTNTLAKEYQKHYTEIIDILYPMTLCSTSILMAYPLWLESWRRTNLIYLFWQIIAFFVLICFSFLMVLISSFSELQLMVFMVNVIVISSFSKWQWSLLSIVSGVLLVTFSFTHYYPESLSEVGLLSSQFKIVYLLMLVSSSLILFLKPKQEHQALTEEKVDHLNGRISFQEKEVQDAWNLRGEFIRNISHEYHAPMTGIYSMTDALIAGYHRFDDKKRLQALQTILKSALRLEIFDSNISSLAVLSKAGYKLNLQSLNLSELVYERVEAMRKLYEDSQKDREFVFDVEEGVVINADKFYLVQTLDNLIVNAITYCKEGKITITLKKYSTGIEFAISDEGIGIPIGELSDIFGEFVVSSKTRSQAGYRGVGLALCKKVIETHGGTIKAESNGTKGARLSFLLPNKLT